MTTKSKLFTWNFIFFIAVSFYSLGAGFVESLVNYPVWHIIGPSDVWINYHKALGPGIIATLAVPALLLQLITNILLLFFRPSLVPKWTVWVTLLLLLIAIISSAIIQIPIQVQLDTGYTKELVDRLISTDLAGRVLIAIARCILILYMMYCMFKNNYQIR